MDTLTSYTTYVSGLGESEDEIDYEAMMILVFRDKLADISESLSASELATLARADDELAGKAELMAEILPGEGSTEENRMAGRWWWFLHEGPQVREQAQAVARA